MMVVFKMRDSVPSPRYSTVCNVLRQWKTSLIPTYRVYPLYDKDVVGPSAMVVESDSVGPSPTVTGVGRYAQSSRRDGQLSQHL